MPAPKPLKVFLVEDNEDTRLVLALLLQSTGCEVSSAGSMNGAIEDVALFDCDLLLSDLGLPDGNGWDLLQLLQRKGRMPYAIAMSGFGGMADIAASKNAGFRHHLVKPVDWDTLERLLEDVRQEIDGAH